ncbi:MAG: dienelactone hydrolase family protein [Gemmatimonadota bacterium]
MTAPPPQARSRHLVVDLPDVRLPGELTVPDTPIGIVLFAHGAGSSRLSPRNQYVARVLQAAGMGTLLFDLLTEPESADRGKVFDIPLLGRRLAEATRWLAGQPGAAGHALGYFGASTGAAAALVAAAQSPIRIGAVVSRGGRLDLAGEALPRVTAPTLLIVGGLDHTVLALNSMAMERLTCPKRLVVVPGATHLFEEPGTLEEVARLAADWFAQYLGGTPTTG